MNQSHRKTLADNYRPVLLAVLLLWNFCGYSQFNPSIHVTINDALGQSQAAPIEGRGMFWDATNFKWRDFQSTAEVLSYLPTSANRFSHFPIYIHLGGTLSGGVWTGGIAQVWFFKDGLANGNLVRWYTDSTSGCSTCLLAANNLSDLANATTARTNIGLGNVDNTSDISKNAAPVSLTNHTINGSLNTLTNIPNSALTNNSIGLSITSNAGSDINVTTTPAALGASLIVNIPSAGSGSRGALTSADWNTFNSKQAPITLTVAGTSGPATFVGNVLNIPQYTAGTGCLNCNADSLKKLPIDTSLRRNGYALTFDSVDQKWVLAPNGAGTGISALTGDATAAGSGSVPITFATVNGNVGTFGSASSVYQGTVNAKGLTTSATSVAIQIAESQVTNLTTDLAAKLSTTLPSADILVGNGSNVATAVSPSGDWTINNAGVNVVGANKITYAKIQMASGQSLLGAQTAGNIGEITLGTNLSMTAGVLNASGGIQETLLGQLYTQKTWANLNQFTNNGGATVSISSSHLSFGTASNNYTKSLDIDSLIGRNGFTDLQKYKAEILIATGTKTSTSYAAIGTRSDISGLLADMIVSINTSTGSDNGKISLVGNGASGGGDTIYYTFPTAVVYTVGDIIKLSTERDNERFIGTAQNITTGTPAVTFTFPFPIALGTIMSLPNQGKFAIFGAGSFIVDSIGVSSNTTKNAAVMNIVDSKGTLYGLQWDNIYTSLMIPDLGSVILEGGSSETASDALNRVPELLSLSSRQSVIELGRNGGIADTASLRALYNALVAGGQTVYFLTPPYDAVSDPIAVVNWEITNFPANNIIDGYYPIKNCGAPCMAGDNVHLTPRGHQVVANQIITSYKLSRGITLLNDSALVKAPGSLLSTGNIPFSGVNNTLYSTPNLIWDNVNSRLGIKNGGPLYDVDLTGTMRASGFLVNANNTSNNASLKLTSFGGIHGYGLDFSTNAGVFFIDTLTNNLEMGLLTPAQINVRDRNGNPLIHMVVGSTSSALTLSGGNVYGGFNNVASNPLTLNAGVSSGNAATQPIIFQTTLAGSSGSTDQTLAERFRIIRKTFSNNPSPNDLAAIDLTGTTTQVFLPPVLTTTQMNAISSPPNGGIIINSDSTGNNAMIYNSGWFAMKGAGGAAFGPVTSPGATLTVANGSTAPQLDIDLTKSNTWNTAAITTFKNNSTADVARFQQSGSTFAAVYLTPSSGHNASFIFENGINTHEWYLSNLSASNNFSFTGSDATSNPVIFTLKQTGQLQFPLYGVGTFTGTATKNLAVDAAGNLIESGLSVTTIGTFSGTSISNGASISGATLTLGVGDGTNPGMVSTTTQTLAGNKLLTGLTSLGGAASSAGEKVFISGNAALTANAGERGAWLSINRGLTNTDASGGAVSLIGTAYIGDNTFAAASATTYTDAGTLVINAPPAAGTNVTITNPWSLYVASGNSKFNGNISGNTNTLSTFTHFIGNNTASIAAGAGAGGSPTVSIIGSDQDGTITITTGTAPTTSATIATITYGLAFANHSFVTLTPTNASTALLSGTSMIFTTGTTTNFTVTSGTVGLTTLTAYQWSYHVGGN